MESKNAGVGRRSFTNWFLGLSLGGLMTSIVYPVFRFMSPPDVPEAATNEVEAGPVNDPELVEKGFKIVRFGAEPVLLVQLGQKEYRAFAATCTHLDCIVEYQKGDQRIWCNCHNGEYDLNGRNVAGPPPKPLEVFAVNLVNGGSGQPETIVISRS
ncbi:MAG: ubiquinol-cytochrome c reductase iron-sulfur subunit [Acidobacteriota bacterium]|nr:MAG: ubiquinol-cytochrome c reductase iron-sulfur subunit [Acidobacteriota bacterium]